jgi:Methyltransferase domain
VTGSPTREALGSEAPAPDPCRLCGAPTEARFVMTVLGRHRVAYRRCTGCGSLQTQTPYWLDEAYGGAALNLDVGAAQRNIVNLAVVSAVATLLGSRRILDFGGGDGLLCRLLRDAGFDAAVQDRFREPAYAEVHGAGSLEGYDLITVFEVMEHLAEPGRELEPLFAAGAAAILTTTALYAGQGPEWRYLAAEAGQHVFFYSDAGLRAFAAAHGYALIVQDQYQLFVRPPAPRGLRLYALRNVLRPSRLPWVKAWAALRPTPGIEADVEAVRRRAKEGAV